MYALRRSTRPDIPGQPAGQSLPIGKLRGVPPHVRAVLKHRRITTCAQLLEAAGAGARRSILVRTMRLDPEILTRLVQRADMSRVTGIGAVFGMMLEDLDIRDVGKLAEQDPEDLHARLRAYNREERIARRSPTPEETADWVGQARGLAKIVTYDA